ncbi:uncharacterized protein LOC135691667 [Rhopilema esculentum]|uniref:uncharacterized protein LOC135691667 n=1 Tax=Rhopilema esculentum TaxID=499914 RepID=UPI0031E31BE1
MESSVRLGGHESTILTNASNHITIVSDLPYKARTRTNFESSSLSETTGKYLKGSRPMHRTTLCFEDKPFKLEYITSTQKAHSIKQNIPRSRPPYKCQSLHHSHFSIGTTGSLDLNTQTMTSFEKKPLIPASKLHQDRTRWNDQVVAGHHMDKSLRHIGFEKVTHETTYDNVHNLLAKKIPCGLPRIKKQPEKFDIISGAYIGPAAQTSHRLCSGNKVLQRTRQDTNENIFG